jgi:hypothetical protein
MKRSNRGQVEITHVILLSITMVIFISLLFSVTSIGLSANGVASEAQFMRISGYVSSEVVRAYTLILYSNSTKSAINVSLILPQTICNHNYGISIETVNGEPQVVAYAQDDTLIQSSSPVCNVNATFSGTIYSTASQPMVKLSRLSNGVIKIWLGNSL